MHDRRRNCLGIALVALAAAWCLEAAGEEPPPFVVETVAGNGKPGDSLGSGPALETPIDQPFGVVTGPDGALYVTSVGQHRVLRIDPSSGALTCVAGSGVKGYAGDGGPAAQAQLNEPYEVRFDSQDNMYFVEMQNHLIRRVDAQSGMISTVAGNPQSGYAGDGEAAAQTRFKQPHSIALDDRGQLYVADIGNHRIRRIDLARGTIDSIAGNGKLELPRDGELAHGNPILGPRALYVVGRTLWIALREGNSVWRLDLDSGILRHVAGTGEAGYSGDGGDPRRATFRGPKGLVATSDGLVYVVDTENQVVRMIDTRGGRIHTVAGGGPASRGYGGDGGAALSARFDRPHGIGIAARGGLVIGDTNNHRVRWLQPQNR